MKNPSQKESMLRRYIETVKSNYDLILIDCAPTESILTTAAYLTSDFVLIPVRPEFLSTIGLPLLRESLKQFDKQYGKPVEVAGIVFNHGSEYAPEEQKSMGEVQAVAASFGWHLFTQSIPFSRSFPKGAREGKPIFWTSYSRSSVSGKVSEFANALGNRIKL